MRGEALALEGGDTPAARRAMLNDAALFADLFGDRPTADLGDLAAREGFAATPVAPLIALARITEPGALRDTLLGQARIRLEARAAYLDRRHAAMAADAQGAPASATAWTSRTTGPLAGGAGGNPALGAVSGSGSGAGAMAEENAAALAALRDDSQTGLAAAADAARAADGVLVPGDVAAILAR